MALAIKCALVAAFVSISIAFLAPAVDANGDRKVYIVYMGEKPSGQILTQSVHINMLDGILEGISTGESLVYSYTRSFNGFAAKLTEREAMKIAGMEGIVSIFPSEPLAYHTTRSWDFLYFPQDVTRNPTKESDVIIGVIDSGIDPTSESFRDDGMGPPPAKWKGHCGLIKCSNKIIGARVYSGGKVSETPVDDIGHGTHIASTAAGQSVQSASLYGIAEGTARGAVPSARIAVYKVCADSCWPENMLAAFDDAIADGVDVLSVSLGMEGNREYFDDPIAIGSFHAMKHGILTSTSAGNSGSSRGTVINTAPWMIVSAASNIDRHIATEVVLGDGTAVVGASVNAFPTQKESFPVLYLGNESSTRRCADLDGKAEGKVVICKGRDTIDYVRALAYRAKGAVMVSDGGLDNSYLFPLPAAAVNSSNAKKIFSYASKTKKPVASIHRSEAIFDSRPPVVASFSSRGPSKVTPNILKPDISAPGIDILAAWSEKATLSPADVRRAKYSIDSGTSMACPHVTGAAAYVKSFHPTWSPAMIMSALMTTATTMDPAKHEGFAELSYGSGQVNPIKAVDPGLVYDATVADYTKLICDQGYNLTMIRLISGDDHTVCTEGEKGDPKDLNYPSMALLVNPGKTFTGVTFKRTVTNVGIPKSKYTAKISTGPKLKVTVEPQSLSFTQAEEKQTFVVTVSGGPLGATSVASASITWSDGQHDVRSPLVVFTN